MVVSWGNAPGLGIANRKAPTVIQPPLVPSTTKRHRLLLPATTIAKIAMGHAAVLDHVVPGALDVGAFAGSVDVAGDEAAQGRHRQHEAEQQDTQVQPDAHEPVAR